VGQKAKKEEDGGFKQLRASGTRRSAACTPNRGKMPVSAGTATVIGRHTAWLEGQGGWQLRWTGVGNGTTALSASTWSGVRCGVAQPGCDALPSGAHTWGGKMGMGRGHLKATLGR
jgi:hypothetical protein